MRIIVQFDTDEILNWILQQEDLWCEVNERFRIGALQKRFFELNHAWIQHVGKEAEDQLRQHIALEAHVANHQRRLP